MDATKRETTNLENQLEGGNNLEEVNEDLRGELQGEPEGFQPTETRDDAEAQKDFWSIQGDFTYRHHSELRFQRYVLKEETFSNPLKYIDVTRATYTNLDVMKEKRVDDYWNLDANRSLSDSRSGLKKFTLLKRATRPDNLLPEVWSNMGKAAQKKEKQECANEKPKLDNARTLRGISFIDPEDGEFEETIKRARIKLEGPVEAAMPCK